MRGYFRFLLTGLILGLFVEALLKLVAGINPPAFLIALAVYPILLSLSFVASRLLDRLLPSTRLADLLHYVGAGVFGLAFEWTLLGNGPSSNALQWGMFAMWTTFCFGPRILSREGPAARQSRGRFWIAFASLGLLLVVLVGLADGPGLKKLIAVVGSSGVYAFLSLWLLRLAVFSPAAEPSTVAP